MKKLGTYLYRVLKREQELFGTLLLFICYADSLVLFCFWPGILLTFLEAWRASCIHLSIISCENTGWSTGTWEITNASVAYTFHSFLAPASGKPDHWKCLTMLRLSLYLRGKKIKPDGQPLEPLHERDFSSFASNRPIFPSPSRLHVLLSRSLRCDPMQCLASKPQSWQAHL